jgi:cardiolipin synthase
MDYRSFQLHFECGVLLYGAPAVEEVLEDLDNIAAQSRAVTMEEWQKRKWYRRMLEPFLRIFAIWM